eukprot:07068_6
MKIARVGVKSPAELVTPMGNVILLKPESERVDSLRPPGTNPLDINQKENHVKPKEAGIKNANVLKVNEKSRRVAPQPNAQDTHPGPQPQIIPSQSSEKQHPLSANRDKKMTSLMNPPMRQQTATLPPLQRVPYNGRLGRPAGDYPLPTLFPLSDQLAPHLA